MKNFVLFILLSFFIEGVFGDSVSVKEGDSVTLHTGLTEIQKDDVLEWRFGAGLDRIARVKKNNDPTTYDDVLDGRFRGRLKLDGQTGDLTITNITTEHDGSYKMSINTKTFRTFSVIGVSGVDEVKSVSLIVGDSVSLNSGTIILRDDVIEWRFVDLNSLIAEHNRKTGNFSTSDGPDGRFRDRLQLDYTTGSLTIRKIGTKHSGVYEAVIRKSSSRHTIHKSYSVTASGEMKSVLSVKKGDSVTLNTDLTEIQTDDLMQWMFRDTVLAEIIKAHRRFLTSDVLDERFRDRLKLDPQTGSLTITDIRFTDSGLYELKTFISSRFIINKRIPVIVTGEIKSVLSVMKGESVTLNSGLTEIQTDDFMLWMFGDTQIAEIKKAHKRLISDERFRDRMKLDNQTGCLTIMNTRDTDSGLYELKISNSRRSILKRFTVTVTDPPLSTGAKVAISVLAVLLVCVTAAAAVIYYRHKISKLKAWIDKGRILSVIQGESIILKVDEVHKDDKLVWMFRNICLAVRRITDGCTVHDGPEERFKDRLKLDDKTGSLTITDTRTTDTGVYELLIIRSGKSSIKRFRVSVFAKTDDKESVSVKEGGPVKLETGVDDIQTFDEIMWTFGKFTPLAYVRGGTKKILPLVDTVFRGRLELDHQTGSLTIEKIRHTDAGIYMLRIIEEGNMKTKLFRVEVDPTDNRNNPVEESVRINNPEESVPLTGVDVPDSRL